MTDWFDNDAFWIATYPFMFDESGFQKAIDDLPKIIDLTGHKSGAVLDMGCGPGRYSVPFAKMGYSVTGVDRTPFLLTRAREYANREQVAVTWVERDMRRFLQSESFDIALSLFTSFGFFESLDDNRAVLRNICESLTPDGVLVMDVVGKERLARVFHPTGSHQLPDGEILVERRSVKGDWEMVETDWIIISGENARTFQMRLWVFSARELKDLLYAAGFQNVTIYGNYERAPYDLDARRLVAVARK